MTFSIAARCPESGDFGVAVTTSNLAVGGRCAFVRAGVGAFLTQHRTDPRLGPLGLDALEAGAGAADAVRSVVDSTPHQGWRQLAAVDRDGNTAVHHGDRMYSIYADARGPGCVAVGNILASPDVTERMIEAYLAAAAAPFPRRLVDALAAGEQAGGEAAGALRSAALRVSGPRGIATCDLRIDDDGSPIEALTALWEAYAPFAAKAIDLALDPGAVEIDPGLLRASRARIAELGLEDRFPGAAASEAD